LWSERRSAKGFVVLIVVEGLSAVGKTNLLELVPADCVVGEEVLRGPSGTGSLGSLP
jgi:hypothetical protein